MSELSYLEKLLDGVEVEWLPLSGLARIRNGKDHKSLSEGEFPVYGSGGIMRYVDTYAYNKPSVLIPRKGSLGNLFFVNVPFWTVDTIFYTEIDEAQIRPKYLYYFLTTVGLGEMNQAGGVPSQTQSVLNKLKIPIPCPDNPEKSLAIQSEIVRILDKFTELTAELTAELSMRKKQYNYYRDQLLSFDDEQEKPIYLEKLLDGVEVEWKTLGEVAKYVRGLIYSKSSESADGQGYKVLRANNITLSNNCLNLNDVKVVRFDTKVKSSQKLYKNDILISAASGSREHVGKVAYIESDIDYYFGGFMGVVRCDEKLNPRYLFHVLTSDIFQKYLDEMLNSSTINNLNSAVMGRFKIPLPCPDTPEKSLAIQSEIVRILDKFDTLTNSITEGLPREIELRQKQYEYYRDLLFSFPKPETVSN
ncbi:restriction endonuclease subunit S [Escherichia coli]|uniref:restriction endonuclease subunit S n=1 Tax=Escherichia coli TaxID=562 RepID=UPI0022F0003F|nr:restriction endonuclease subunit S [Escherichia coli]MDA4331789.1 restriction endonuclease subunit S [Escherichia coli]